MGLHRGASLGPRTHIEIPRTFSVHIIRISESIGLALSFSVIMTFATGTEAYLLSLVCPWFTVIIIYRIFLLLFRWPILSSCSTTTRCPYVDRRANGTVRSIGITVVAD